MLVQFANSIPLNRPQYHDHKIPTFTSDDGIKGMVCMSERENHTHISVRLIGTLNIESTTGEGIWTSTRSISTTKVLDIGDLIRDSRDEIYFNVELSDISSLPMSLDTGLSLQRGTTIDDVLNTMPFMKVKLEYHFVVVAYQNDAETQQYAQEIRIIPNHSEPLMDKVISKYHDIRLQPRSQSLLKTKSRQQSADLTDLTIELEPVLPIIHHANSDHAVTKFAMKVFCDDALERSDMPPKMECSMIYTLKPSTTITVSRHSRNEKLYLERIIRLKSETFTIGWRRELDTRAGVEAKRHVWVSDHESWLVAPNDGASNPTFQTPNISHGYQLEVKMQVNWSRRHNSLKGNLDFRLPVAVEVQIPGAPRYEIMGPPPPIDEGIPEINRIIALESSVSR